METTAGTGGARTPGASAGTDSAMGWPVGGPWSVRSAARRGGRPALEIYEDGELIDVLAASSLSRELLRGARRSAAGGRSSGSRGFAWGRLAHDGSVPSVAFAGARLRPHWRPAEVTTVAGEFWLAWAPGPLAAVQVRQSDGHTARLRPGRPL